MRLARATAVFLALVSTSLGCGGTKRPRDASVGDGSRGDAGSCTVVVPALATRDLVAGRVFPRAVAIVPIPGSSDLAIVEQTGLVEIVRAGAVLPTPFLDLTSRPLFDGSPSDPGEQGLLGLAFHPDYASNGRFFVAYTVGEDASIAGNQRRNVVAEYARSAPGSDVASDTEVARLVEIVDPAPNHNGGQLAFDADGFLYAGLGDGGGANDAGHGTCGSGLSTSTLLGKILRLDVSASASEYAAPNPPFSGASGLPQIAHYGLRNPWRFSFDRTTHDLWIGDVGQNAWEEIDFLAAGSALGVNFGWARFEGSHPTTYVPDPSCDALAANAVPPIVDFAQKGPNELGAPHAIVGGYVYRGSAIAGLDGTYLFGDAISNQVAAMKRCPDGSVAIANVEALSNLDSGLSSFGEGADGELYLAYVGSGRVLSIVPTP